MVKKYTSIFLILFAYAILLGHNTIPHHHYDSDHDTTEHHHSDQQSDEDADDKDLKHLLVHFAHSADGFKFTTSHNTNNIISKQPLLIVALLPVNIQLVKFIIPPLSYNPLAEHFIYISPHSRSLGLRGPPAFFS